MSDVLYCPWCGARKPTNSAAGDTCERCGKGCRVVNVISAAEDAVLNAMKAIATHVLLEYVSAERNDGLETPALAELDRRQAGRVLHGELKKEIVMIKIGFWRPAPLKGDESTVRQQIHAQHMRENAHLPDPSEFVDYTWETEEMHKVVDYLNAQPVTASYRGKSTCRCCGLMNGSRERSDGVYLWPEGYSHYLMAHHVRPPQEFIDHALGKKPQLASEYVTTKEQTLAVHEALLAIGKAIEGLGTETISDGFACLKAIDRIRAILLGVKP